jgi:Zn-dependent peptidase ImmA (M78 family)
MTSRTSPKREAARLLERYEQSSPPIEVERIARGEGAVIVTDSLDRDISGVLIRTDDQIVIAVNSSHHPRRQRFTISHEIGHMTLHRGREYTVDSTVRLNWRDDLSGLATDRQEIDANAFAADLLMPEAMVRRAITNLARAGLTSEARAIQQLARDFDVSREAMSFRLMNLGIAI